MEKIHPDLKTKAWINSYIGAPLSALIAAGIFLTTGRLFMAGSEPLPVLIFRLCVGMIFVWAAGYIWRSASWYERITKVLHEIDPISAKLHFTRNKAGSPVVTLIPVKSADFSELQIVCGDTKWDFSQLENAIVKVHIDPKPGGSAVIETPLGIVWPLERQPVKRVTYATHVYQR
jgi:hypothetical protein